ncbi:MAG: PD-(D/E)XK nuclease family protein, partial [Firmicutes bacterium]|nr:PD-(D/E)XK nuclease family protein [Bacillota bacterium]
MLWYTCCIELIRRVINSESAQREYTFTVEINAEDYTPEIEPEFAKNKIVMQGAIDLLFIENGEAVIVDYKTDRVKDSQKLIEMYRKQLELYRNAVETITKLNVREVLIYSVYNNEI